MAIGEQGGAPREFDLELTAAQSQAIFNDFVQWQLAERQRLTGNTNEVPEEMRNVAPRLQLALGPLSQLKSRFHALADTFSQSEAREVIRAKAASVDLRSLTPQAFRDLLTEVFEGGLITQERILVVYYFCSDIAIRAIEEDGVYLFQRFMSWSANYLRDKVSAVIARQGGWLTVLNSGLNCATKIALTIFCVLAGTTIAAYMLNKK